MTESMHPHPLAQRLKGRNLYLVGMMGSGKSSSGPFLAQRLGYRFVDSDVVIEKLLSMEIHEIFEKNGEAEFREIESQVLNDIGQRHSLVVATGGGVVTRPTNWGIMHQGLVIWLDPGQRKLLRRLQLDPASRPLLDGEDPEEQLKVIFGKRKAFYAESDLHIEVGGEETADQVALSILEKLPSILCPPEDLVGQQTTGG
ncbi:shikimate kinase [Prochlorococcus sp. MIT 1300]|uniref:shikimate kinase n=1 Tax=Prochlorococcus sp. MIT 1300 TaxID=3096218 RepID=UPI002A7533B3|nr:shikimate kinase [Prochlorococcus sp. MIT 1300]